MVINMVRQYFETFRGLTPKSQVSFFLMFLVLTFGALFTDNGGQRMSLYLGLCSLISFFIYFSFESDSENVFEDSSIPVMFTICSALSLNYFLQFGINLISQNALINLMVSITFFLFTIAFIIYYLSRTSIKDQEKESFNTLIYNNLQQHSESKDFIKSKINKVLQNTDLLKDLAPKVSQTLKSMTDVKESITEICLETAKTKLDTRMIKETLPVMNPTFFYPSEITLINSKGIELNKPYLNREDTMMVLALFLPAVKLRHEDTVQRTFKDIQQGKWQKEQFKLSTLVKYLKKYHPEKFSGRSHYIDDNTC